MNAPSPARRRCPALSIAQPWAWAILHCGKRIENRDRWTGCRYRGEVWLHASKGTGTLAEFHQAIVAIDGLQVADVRRVAMPGRRRPHSGPLQELWIPRGDLDRGGIVGRARIVDVIENEPTFAAWAQRSAVGEQQRVWWQGGFALVLADVRAVPFTPCVGALGLFAVPQEIESQIVVAD